MYRSFFGGDLFAEMDRLQRRLQPSFDLSSPSIRGVGDGGFPAINVGDTPAAIEIYAFVPGVEPASIDVTVDRGLLSISGERKPQPQTDGSGTARPTLHAKERFEGRFLRAISLPEDCDVGSVQADCRDGVLHINIKREAAAQPRRIPVQ